MKQFKFLLLSLLLITSVAFSQINQVKNTGNFAIVQFQDISPFTTTDAIGSYFTTNGLNYQCGYVYSITQTPVFPIFGDDNTTVCQDGYNYNQNINFYLDRNGQYYDLDYHLSTGNAGYYSNNEYTGLGIIAVKDVTIRDKIQILPQPQCAPDLPPASNALSKECITVSLSKSFEFNIYARPGVLNNSFALNSEIKNYHSVFWKVIDGKGKLYFADSPKAKYQIHSKDRKTGTQLKFLLTIIPKNPECPEVSEVVTVTLN